MAKSKQIKRTLVSTFITFLLCVAMLIGSTYAWFADNATVSASKIEAAVMECVLEKGTTTTDNGTTTTTWENAAKNKSTFDNTTLSPTDKTATLKMRVVNQSTFNVKYTLKFTKSSGDSDLPGELNVYVDKKSDTDTTENTNENTNTTLPSTAEDTPPGKYIGTLADVISNSVITSGTLKAAQKVSGSEEDSGKFNCAYDEITLTLQLNTSNTSNTSIDDTQGKSLAGLAVTLLASQCDPSAVSDPSTQVITYDKQNKTYVQIANANAVANTVSLLDGDSASETEEIEDVLPFDLEGVCSFRSLDDLNSENPYADYHADIVVTADRDMEAENLLIATYSELFCDVDWLGWINDEKLIAGQQTRLLRALWGDDFVVSYAELFEDDAKIKCAVTDLGDNAGVTVRVELRLYEVADGEETGEFLVIGDYEHTF